MNDWWRIHYEDAKLACAALMKFYPFTLEDLDGEQWVDVPNYEGLYQVSTFGRVKSFTRGKVKILKPFIDIYGYLTVGFHKNNTRKNFYIHRLVAVCFVPNPDNKPEVNHVDGHVLNNHVSNFEHATHAENIQHAYRLGLRPSGVENPLAKLTKEQILYIRENPDKLTSKNLAQEFNVSVATIGAVQLGRKYKTEGGTIRESEAMPRIPDNVRQEIRRLYVKNSREFGTNALAKKYKISSSVVRKIVHERR